MPDALLAGFFGLLIGSFLNVCIHRWPRDLSVVRPRSACPACGRPIAWYDNIPLASWLALRGRCRHCRERISWRYPLVELLTALSFAWFVFQFGLTWVAVKFCIFSATLIALVFSDLETLLLPDELTIGGLAIGLLFSFVVPVQDSSFHFAVRLFQWRPSLMVGSFGEAAFGAIIPAGAIWAGGWLFAKLRHKDGLGFGDVKMLAMIGAFLGLRGALLTIILGSFLGSIVGLAFIKATGKDPATYQLPFGTFLGIAAFLAAIEGQRVISWYAQTLH